MGKTSYAIALGSNRRSGHGSPADAVRAAAFELGVSHLSPIIATAAVGPAGRSFANAAAILQSELDPPDLLRRLKKLERDFGRRSGRRWGPRILDLDIILWSGGSFAAQGLVIPHPSFRERGFVLAPLLEIAAEWKDPLTSLTVRQLHRRLLRPRPVDRRTARA